MPSGIDLTSDQLQFVEIRRRLKEAGSGGLTRELNRSLKQAAQPIVQAEKAAALGLPSHGDVHTGLRQSIADATTTRVSTAGSNPGVIVYTQEKKTRGKLGRDTNRARGWKHPVFGNRAVWVQQISSPGWWNRAAQPSARAALGLVEQALERIAQKIARG